MQVNAAAARGPATQGAGGSGGGGAALFAAAQAAWQLHVAMVLLGVGCAPVLMGAYFIFARLYPAQVFATLAAVRVVVCSLCNLA